MKSSRLTTALIVLLLEASPPSAQPASVSAGEGSVAIGGSVTDSEIIIGIPESRVDELVRERTKPLEALTASQKETIDLLKQNLELTQGQVRAALEILGEKDIPPERLAAKLVEVAKQFKQLRATAAAEPGDDAEVTALKKLAQDAIDEGKLDQADKLLAELLTMQLAARDRLASNAATTLARRAEVALAGLEYLKAARYFADAARTLPPDKEHFDRRFR